MQTLTLLLPILLAAAAPVEAALADGKITLDEAAAIVKAIGPAVTAAFPTEARYVQLAEDVAEAVVKFLGSAPKAA